MLFFFLSIQYPIPIKSPFHEDSLYNEPNIVEDVIIRRLGWECHIIRMEEERIPKKGIKLKLLHHKTSGKTKNQMGGCGPEGYIATAGDKKMEEKN